MTCNMKDFEEELPKILSQNGWVDENEVNVERQVEEIMLLHVFAVVKAQDEAFKAGYIRGGIDQLNKEDI